MYIAEGRAPIIENTFDRCTQITNYPSFATACTITFHFNACIAELVFEVVWRWDSPAYSDIEWSRLGYINGILCLNYCAAMRTASAWTTYKGPHGRARIWKPSFRQHFRNFESIITHWVGLHIFHIATSSDNCHEKWSSSNFQAFSSQMNLKQRLTVKTACKRHSLV